MQEETGHLQIAITFIIARLMKQALWSPIPRLPLKTKIAPTTDMISHLVSLNFKLRSSTVYVNQEVCT